MTGIFLSTQRIVRLATPFFCVCAMLTLLRCQTALATPTVPKTTGNKTISSPSGPVIRVEFFGAEKGYAVRNADVTLLCVVRNIGTEALPEKTVRLHCYAITGLDYTSGETFPILPALARNQAVTYRWRLESNTNDNALVAGVVVEDIGERADTTQQAVSAAPAATSVTLEQHVVVSVIPLLAAPLHGGSRSIAANGPPQAGNTPEDTWIGNDRVLARVVSADHRRPLMMLSARNSGSWQEVATGVSLGDVRSAEEGQPSWWESFRWHDTRIQADSESATLTLLGTVGSRWRAELVLETQRNTAAIKGSLRLTALRTLRLYAVQVPRFIALNDPKGAAPKTDGTPGLLKNDESVFPQDARVTAGRANGATVGLSWPAESPFTEGTWTGLPVGDNVFAPALGAQWNEERGEVILKAATVIFPFRLFALAPSDTLRDAMRFILP